MQYIPFIAKGASFGLDGLTRRAKIWRLTRPCERQKKKITFMTDQNSFCAIGCHYSCVACFQWELHYTALATVAWQVHHAAMS